MVTKIVISSYDNKTCKMLPKHTWLSGSTPRLEFKGLKFESHLSRFDLPAKKAGIFHG
jgi:hypothetical protein